MGQRNLERYGMHEWRRKAETIADMLREGWDVVSWCDVCHLEMAVDLPALIKLKGQGLSLWNRKPPCRRLRCKGRAHFKARVPGLYQYRELVAPWPDDVPPRLTQGELAAKRRTEHDGG